MRLVADQALLLESHAGLEGEPAEGPGILEVAALVTRISRGIRRGIKAALVLQDDGEAWIIVFVRAKELSAVGSLPGCLAEFGQVGKRKIRAGVKSKCVVVNIILELVTVGDGVASEEAEDVGAGNGE